MIQISPAILTDDIQEFEKQLNIYKQFASQIDIDINIPDKKFEGVETVSLTDVKPLITRKSLTYGVHLMTSRPLSLVKELIKDWGEEYNLVIYVHQEAAIDNVLKLDMPDSFELGVVVKAESDLRTLSFYNKFSEVQIMTIETGKQGNKFQPDILMRSDKLVGEGYSGKVSIDGGIGLRNARRVNRHPISRVSVGSYFSKSYNPITSYAKLKNALNNKNNY